MGVFKAMFAGPETGGKVVDGVTSAIDKFTFTPQERSASSERAFELYIKYMEATSGQNLARRYIAMLSVGLWAFLIIVAVITGLVEQFLFATEDSAMPASNFVLGVLSGTVTPIVITIVAFYFSKGMVDQGMKVWADRKKKRRNNDDEE